MDGDGSFYLNWLYDKKGLPTSLQYYLRISQRRNYHRKSVVGTSYFDIMNKLSIFFSVPLRYRDRLRKSGYRELSYEVRTSNYVANYTLLSYLIQFPLFSYKYLAVVVQIECLQLSVNREYKLPNGDRRLKALKRKSKWSNYPKATRNRLHDRHLYTHFPINQR